MGRDIRVEATDDEARVFVDDEYMGSVVRAAPCADCGATLMAESYDRKAIGCVLSVPEGVLKIARTADGLRAK